MFTRLPLFYALMLVLSCGAMPQMARAQAEFQNVPMTIPADKERRQISVVVKPGLTKTSSLPTKELKEARKAMLDGQQISDADMRALAERWDGLAAQRYVRRLEALNDPQYNSDIAYFASIAVSTGRVWTLPDAIDAMVKLEPETEPTDRKKVYMGMLYPHAWAGNSLALDALIDLNGEGKLFGPMSEETRKKIMAQGEANGDGRVDLRMALALLQQPSRTAAEMEMTVNYLNRAMASDNFAVKTTAANILASLQTNGNGAVASQ